MTITNIGTIQRFSFTVIMTFGAYPKYKPHVSKILIENWEALQKFDT